MEKNIGRMVKIASNQLSREFDKFAKPYDLTGTQMSIIDFLSHDWKEEYFQQDIEKEFNIQRSTTTVLLQRMDARKKSVHLTEKALALVDACQDYFVSKNAELENQFTEEEIAIFEKILHYYIKEK